MHPRQIRIAIDYAAENADEVHERINRHHVVAESSRAAAPRRETLLA